MKKLLRSLRHAARDNALEALLRASWLLHRLARRAGPAPSAAPAVIVSLTSYPPRFPTLHLTLKSLLMQSDPDHKVVLWVAERDLAALPASVTALRRWGLEIGACDDIRSYKKLIPTLEKYGPVTVVTADDDIYYWRTWLAELVALWRASNGRQIICHRRHRIAHGADGLPLPYAQWQFESALTDASVLNFPTGIGGVLYPAGIFTDAVLDREAFMRLCPYGDDIWFYWMGRTNGATFRGVPAQRPIHTWRGSQDAALWLSNIGENRNDVQIGAMIDAYGYFERRAARA
nr:hypothetical protein [uncultured Duganella sp.]